MNHLANSTSPYLLQHASNPVDWYPWGEEALEKARREDRPIFLSIGYAACHWCHVMAHESFEDPETARIMNRYFVNIKVDREERPDLDDLYMQAVVAMTGQGGWPMSVFLTPEGIPFYGGTYFPPVRRYNMPAFREVLLALAQAWQNERENLLAYGKRLHTHLRTRPVAPQAAPPPDAPLLEQAARHLAETHDEARGGWGKAPKFPQPMAITFLLSQPGAPQAETAFRALERMARGGMYDVVGGGFARYSTDDNWLVPHFEKMLYDNALLARAYLQAALQSGRADFRRTAERTLDFLLREMRHPAGGFFSSLDADS
ncbi:MAG: thioredoxin domain-containing protein, partial [Anaerolineae bacterium]